VRARSRPPKATAAFVTFVLDQLAGLDELTSRPMFGGVGLYSRGLFFGIIARGDVLYLRAGDQNRQEIAESGAKAFKPSAQRRGSLRYFAVPLDILESPLDLTRWAHAAVAAAEASARLKRPVRLGSRTRPPGTGRGSR
jgi:TfoX/Sxy family transcriptional regulator of competence genes